MKTIGVVTSTRADWGIYTPVLRAIDASPELELEIYATGMHLSPHHGLTVRRIEEDGFEVAETVEMLGASDSPSGIALSMGVGTEGFARLFARRRPDILLVLGDRFDMLPAVIAALPFRIAVAHICGGELTEGLIDDPIRHGITKMSHLHFVQTRIYADRVIQLGEEPWRVTLCGSPSLDHLADFEPMSRDELGERFGITVPDDFALVTFHPVTLEYEHTRRHIDEVLAAIAISGLRAIFTYPNADTFGREIIEAIEGFVRANPQSQAVVSLGTRGYFSLLSRARVMIGNSSSGIIEAASFKLPVVDIGNRQRGRAHGRNVWHAPCERDAVAEAIERATDPSFVRSLDDLENPYFAGGASERIVCKLLETRLDDAFYSKRFRDRFDRHDRG